MEGEPINLLVLGENYTFQDNFIEDVVSFLKGVDYEPANGNGHMGNITFKALFREFCIISGPVLTGSDSAVDVSSKFSKIQDHFYQPLNLNAIIFLLPPYPLHYEHFLSLNLFTNFCKEDMAMIEKIVMFVFVHNDPVSSQKRDMVDANLWTVLDRIGANILHSKTFHCHSRLNEDFCNTFLQFIYMNKRTLPLENVYSHESVVEVVGNEKFLDLTMEALFVNDDNIHYLATGERKKYILDKWNNYRTVCTNQKCSELQYCCNCSEVTTKSHLGLCDALINRSTCKKCNCPVNNHIAVNYYKYTSQFVNHNTEQLKKNELQLITILVAIDLFHKKNNASVGQFYVRLKERIKQEIRYSALETLYQREMGSCKKEITADDCMKCIRKSVSSFKGLNAIRNHFEHSALSTKGNLRVICGLGG